VLSLVTRVVSVFVRFRLPLHPNLLWCEIIKHESFDS
jgi:hypothetical protein